MERSIMNERCRMKPIGEKWSEDFDKWLRECDITFTPCSADELRDGVRSIRNVAYLAGLKKAVEVIKESAGDPDVLRYSIEAIEAVIAKGGVDAAHRR